MKTKILNLLLFIFLTCNSFNIYSQEEKYITLWNTERNFYPGNVPQLSYPEIILKVSQNNAPYSVTVWKQNSDESFTYIDEMEFPENHPNAHLSFYEHGIYKIELKTESTQFRITSGNGGPVFGNDDKLIKVLQWGTIPWSSFSSMFYNNKNMDVFATDTPNTTNATDMDAMFKFCYSFTGLNTPIQSWNMSNITSINSMFTYNKLFNANLNDWNVSNVTSMNSTFAYNLVFNQPLDKWNVTNTQYFNELFMNAQLFNQDISQWDMENALDISKILYGAKQFNYSLNNWKLDQVEEAFYALYNSGIDCINYSKTLEEWAIYPNTPNNIDFGQTWPLKYNEDGQVGRNYLTDSKGWLISLDEFDSYCSQSLDIEANEINKIKIYPNPTSDYIYVSGIPSFDYEIYDSRGSKISDKRNNLNEIDVRNLSNGLYILNIKTVNNSDQFFKFIKK